MFRIAIVEDEEEIRCQLGEYAQQYAQEYKTELEISLFSDGSELLAGYRPIYDILFLDIDMPGINGMETAERIRTQDDEVVIVFVTNLMQYAIQGYAVRALDYVLKPITYGMFCLKLDKAIAMVRGRGGGQIILRLNEGIQRLDTRQIYYVEVQRGVLRYVTALGEFMVRGTLQSAAEELENYHFVRCNYWYLVNLLHVTKVGKDTAEVAGIQLQISRRNRSGFMAALTEYVGGGV